MVQLERRRAPFIVLYRAIDQRVYRGRSRAAFGAHDQRRLASESGIGGLGLCAASDMARQRRLADAGVAEEAEDLRLARIEPAANLIEGGALLAGPIHSRVPL